MAATNRRQLLTGAAAYAAGAAIVAGGAALASEAKGATLDRAAWNAAMSHLNRQITRGAIDDSNDQAEAEYEARHRLLQMPAPDAEALAWKINYLFEVEEDGFYPSYAPRFINQTLADAIRLAGGTPAGVLA